MLGKTKVEVPTNTFDPVPEDSYTCQVVDVNIDSMMNTFKKKEETVLNFKFAILDKNEMLVTNKKGKLEKGSTRGRFLWRRCAISRGKRSNLYKLTKAVNGKALTKEEWDEFNADDLVGRQVGIETELSLPNKDGIVWANIINFFKAPKQLEPMPEEDIKKAQEEEQPIQKTTSPAVAPKEADAEADDFIKGLEKDKEARIAEDEEEEGDKRLAELEAEMAKLKAKKAKK